MEGFITDDWQLWLAMGAVAVFYHYATWLKKAALPYVLSSVAVSVLAIASKQGWIAVFLAQALLFAFWEMIRKNRERKR